MRINMNDDDAEPTYDRESLRAVRTLPSAMHLRLVAALAAELARALDDAAAALELMRAALEAK